MVRVVRLGALTCVAVAAAGCVDTLSTGGLTVAGVAAPGSSAATWQMPWQISPIGPAAAANGEQTILSYVPQSGFVRGTPSALASIGRPLEAASGRNRTVETCRATVESEAMKVGARDVEAVSAGPDQTARDGKVFAPVRMRITYVRSNGYEVREATMTCIVDRRGKIVDAFV